MAEIILVEDQSAGTITLSDAQPVEVVHVEETIEISQVESQAIQVTLADSEVIQVEITGDVGTVARLAAAVVEAEENASQSALEASQSATNSAGSASAAAGSATAAATSEQNALNSATQANQSKLAAESTAATVAGLVTDAQTAANNSAGSANASSQYATASNDSATESADSATASAGSATAAAASATAAGASESAAAGYAANSASSATDSASSAGTSTTQAGIATTQAGIATQARIDAEAAEAGAQTAEGNAASSATAASGSATAAAGSASTAQSHASNAAADRLLASQYATYPEDQLIPGTLDNSSKHWAAKAASSAASASGQVEFLGSWDAAANGTPPTPSNSARYVVISDGTVDGKAVYTNDFITYSVPDAEWFVTPGSGNVSSVNGLIGAVELDYGNFAGAQHIVLNNAVQIQGRTATTGTYAIARVGSDNRIRLGDENSAGLALQSPSEPYWTDGVTSRTLVHVGGGQNVAGMNFTSSVSMANNFGYYGKKSDGSWTLVGMVDSSNRTRFGNSALQTRIDSANAPQWYNGSATYELLHTGGGQSIAGTTTVGKLWINGGVEFGYWNSGQTDIDAVVPGTTFGGIIEAPASGHMVIGIRGNDTNDGLYVIDTNNGGDAAYARELFAVNGSTVRHLGRDLIHTGGGQSISGTTTLAKLVLPPSGDVNLATSNIPLMIGNQSSSNLAFDENEIQARNNGVAAALNLNLEGGVVSVGSGGLSTTGTVTAGLLNLANDGMLAAYTDTGNKFLRIRANNGTWATPYRELLIGNEGTFKFDGKDILYAESGKTTPDLNVTNYIKLGPGVPANDDGHIEWLGDANAGFMRLSTSDDNGTERIEFGDYDLVDRGGSFTQWLQLQRGTALFTGDVKTTNEFRVDRNSGSGFKQVQAGSGGYYLGHWSSGAHFRLEQISTAGGWEKTWINAYRDAGVGLYYNGGQKAATTNTGFNINGTLDVATVAATSTITSQGVITSTTYGNSHIGYGTGNAASTYLTHGTGGAFYVRTYDGTSYVNALTVNGAGNASLSGSLSLLDTKSINIGTGGDLQLQHNGASSYIDNYTGNLWIRQLDAANSIAVQVRDTGGTMRTVAQGQGNTANPYFRTFYGTSEKTRTISSGLQVYGTLSADTDVSTPAINGIAVGRFIYGAGVSGTNQLSSSWDETAKSGFYDGDSKTSAPTASGWYWGLFASHSNAGSYGWQLVTNNSTNPQMYLRGKANNVYGSWNAVITSNLTSCSVAGNFGVGGVTPGNAFNNGKAMAFGDNDTGIRQNGDGVLELWANNQEIQELTSSAITMHKAVTFSAGFTRSSDRTLKKNLRRKLDLPALHKKLLKIQWLTFDWKDGRTEDDFGVIAQEVQKILPEVVKRVNGKLTVDYERIHNYWCAVNAWQDQRIEKLETAMLKAA